MAILGDNGPSPTGLFAGIAYTLTALAGVIAAATAAVKAFRPDKPATPAGEGDDVYRTRVTREAIEAEAEALERAYALEDKLATAEAEAAEWRDKYVHLLEERHP